MSKSTSTSPSSDEQSSDQTTSTTVDTDSNGNAALSSFSSSSDSASTSSSGSPSDPAPPWPLPNRPAVAEDDAHPPEYVTDIKTSIKAAFGDESLTAEQAPTAPADFDITTGHSEFLAALVDGLTEISDRINVVAVDAGLQLTAVSQANTILGRTFLPASCFKKYTVNACRFTIDSDPLPPILEAFSSNATVRIRAHKTVGETIDELSDLAAAERAVLEKLDYTTTDAIAQASFSDLKEQVTLPTSIADPGSDSTTSEDTEYHIEHSRADTLRHRCQPKLFITRASEETLPSPISRDTNEEAGNYLPIELHHLTDPPSLPDLTTDTTAILPSDELNRLATQADAFGSHIQLSTDPQTVHGHCSTSTDEAHITTAATTFGGISTTLVSTDLFTTACSFLMTTTTSDSRPVIRHLIKDSESASNTDGDRPDALKSYPIELAHEYETATASAFSKSFIAPRVKKSSSSEKTQFTEVAYNGESAPVAPPIYAQQSIPTRQPVPYPKAVPAPNAEYIGTIARSDILDWLIPQQAHTSEARYYLTEKGIKTAHINSSNVVAGRGTLQADAFEEYNANNAFPDGPITIGWPHGSLTDSLAHYPEDSLISLYYDDSTRKLILIGAGLQLTVACIDPDSIRKPSLPTTVKFSSKAFLSLSDLRAAVNDVKTAANNAVTLTLCNGTLHAYGATETLRNKDLEDTNPTDISHKNEVSHSVRTFEATGVAQARYSIDYLLDWLNELKNTSAKTGWLYFGTDIPLLFESEIKSDTTTTTTILAPRISTDDDDQIPDQLAIQSLPTTAETLATANGRWKLTDSSDLNVPDYQLDVISDTTSKDNS